MVRPALVLLFVLAFSSCMGIRGGSSSVSSVTLSWKPSASEAVIGYKIYVGRASGDYFRTYNVGNVTTCTVKDLERGVYYFVCTACDASGKESNYSNEVTITL